jgi:hypothetical protein
MIYLALRKSPRMAPLQKAPFILRFFLTSAAILVMFSVMIAVQAESQIVDESCAPDVGWDLTTMWH